MKIEKQEERQKAVNPLGAYLDAQRRNKENINKFSREQHELADAIYTKAVDAYTRSRIYRNYRDNFIAIKVENVSLRDKLGFAVPELHKFCENNGVEAVKIGKNLVYRILKTA